MSMATTSITGDAMATISMTGDAMATISMTSDVIGKQYHCNKSVNHLNNMKQH